jgi:UDP-glucose 4-epimerase
MSSTELQSALVNARCLVTGGAGFIGSNLTDQLLQYGARVTVLDDFSTGRREHLPSHDRLEIVDTDLAQNQRLHALVEATDYVFHLAAQVGNVKSIDAPVRDAGTNIIGTVRLIEACRRASIRRMVYSSSSAIFGEAQKIPIAEDHPLRPASFYALSKLTGEHYVRLASGLLGLPAVCLRYFNVYGLPMEDSEYTGVISIFLRRLERGEPLTIYGDGQQVRDFVHVNDVVQANLRAALEGRPGEVYNIGTGEGTTILQLADILAELIGRVPVIEFADFRPGEVRRSTADIAKARAEIGFCPTYSIRLGLADVIRTLGPLAVHRDQ